MISRIEGDLIALLENGVEVRCGELTYHVLVPAADLGRLATEVGRRVEFHVLYYLEGQGQGSSFIPRLIGFGSADDRAFFELFTTVKGLGNRKALRALQLPFRRVAEAIASRDTDILRSLPEIGKRTAETIVVELSDKVDRFVELKPDGRSTGVSRTDEMRDAIATLVALGEGQLAATETVDRAVRADPDLTTADTIVTAALRLRQLP